MRFVCPDGESHYRPLIEGPQLAALEAEGHSLEWFDGAPVEIAGWVERVRGADGILLLWSLPPGVLGSCPSIRIVAFAGTGAGSYVALEEASQCGVVVCNVPSYGANAVAEHVFALTLAVVRGVPAGDRLVRAGRWEQRQAGFELRGRVLGVVGVGPIGARVAQLGRAFGMDVIAWTRSPSPERARQLAVRFVPLLELFEMSDVVSLHLAAVPETERLIDGKVLARLRPSAVLVNTARGALVDMDALAELLAAEKLRGAGIDVFDPEPPSPDDALLGSQRVVMTPHVGFLTGEASTELFRTCLENLLAFARGRAQNVVVLPEAR